MSRSGSDYVDTRSPQERYQDGVICMSYLHQILLVVNVMFATAACFAGYYGYVGFITMIVSLVDARVFCLLPYILLSVATNSPRMLTARGYLICSAVVWGLLGVTFLSLGHFFIIIVYGDYDPDSGFTNAPTLPGPHPTMFPTRSPVLSPTVQGTSFYAYKYEAAVPILVMGIISSLLMISAAALSVQYGKLRAVVKDRNLGNCCGPPVCEKECGCCYDCCCAANPECANADCCGKAPENNVSLPTSGQVVIMNGATTIRAPVSVPTNVPVSIPTATATHAYEIPMVVNAVPVAINATPITTSAMPGKEKGKGNDNIEDRLIAFYSAVDPSKLTTLGEFTSYINAAGIDSFNQLLRTKYGRDLNSV